MKNEKKIVEYYKHHGEKSVAVFSEVKGKHREHCLCYECEKMKKGGAEGQCEIAQAVYDNCVKYDLVSPVYECPEFKEKKRKLIICIVGESASGKSRSSAYIRDRYNIPLIQSFTERDKRESELAMEARGESLDHTFITKEEFDAIDPQDMIAFTDFGPYRYCCTNDTVVDRNLYIIDEFGLKHLKSFHSDKFDIVSIRFTASEAVRIERANGDGQDGQARIDRDKGKFTMENSEFDYVIATDICDEVTSRNINTALTNIFSMRGEGFAVTTGIKF